MFIKISNNQIEKYPYTAADLYQDFPNTSFPGNLENTDLSNFGVFRIASVPKPSAEWTKIVEELSPENIDGIWTQKWIVRDATEQELVQITQNIVAEYTRAIQQYLDITARTRNYENILSACSYAAGNHPKYSVEGQDCLNWREAVWDKGYEILNDVQAGIRPLPTIEQVIAELPPMVWTN